MQTLSIKLFSKLFLLLFLFFFSNSKVLIAQADSLKLILQNTQHDSSKIKIYFDLGNLYLDGPSDSLLYYYFEANKLIEQFLTQPENVLVKVDDKTINTYKNLHFRAIIEIAIEEFFQGDYQESKKYNLKALEIAEEINDPNLISEAYGALGILYKNQGEYGLALEYYEKALATAIEVQDTSWIAACYANVGNVHRRLTNYTKALDYFLKALEIFEQHGETRRIAVAYLNIGNLYDDQNDYSTALEYYSKALQLSFETDDQNRISECLMNIGTVYLIQDQFAIAREYFEKSHKIYNALNYQHILDNCYIYIGKTYEGENDLLKALEYYDKALTIAEYENDKITISEIYGNLANLSLQTNRLNKAIEYGEKSLSIGLETRYLFNIKNAYHYLSQAYEGSENYYKSLEYYKLYSGVKDSIFNTEKYKSIKDIEMKYETEKKEQQLILLSERNQVQQLMLSRRNWLVLALLIITILVILLGYIVFRNSRLKAKHQAVELEQKLMRAQMNPHFIFNSLIAIQSFIYNKKPVIAGDYLAKFADLVRMTLDNSRIEFVSLEKEIRMLEAYFELQTLRFENKFEYVIEQYFSKVNDNIEIPPMMAQPFIENAIEHGIRHKKGKGFIKVHFSNTNHHIKCIIEDDGVGREKAHELELKRKHQSMATSITKDRLKILSKKYRQNFQLKIIDLKENNKPTGTRIEFNIPYISGSF